MAIRFESNEGPRAPDKPAEKPAARPPATPGEAPSSASDELPFAKPARPDKKRKGR